MIAKKLIIFSILSVFCRLVNANVGSFARHVLQQDTSLGGLPNPGAQTRKKQQINQFLKTKAAEEREEAAAMGKKASLKIKKAAFEDQSKKAELSDNDLLMKSVLAYSLLKKSRNCSMYNDSLRDAEQEIWRKNPQSVHLIYDSTAEQIVVKNRFGVPLQKIHIEKIEPKKYNINYFLRSVFTERNWSNGKALLEIPHLTCVRGWYVYDPKTKTGYIGGIDIYDGYRNYLMQWFAFGPGSLPAQATK